MDFMEDYDLFVQDTENEQAAIEALRVWEMRIRAALDPQKFSKWLGATKWSMFPVCDSYKCPVAIYLNTVLVPPMPRGKIELAVGSQSVTLSWYGQRPRTVQHAKIGLPDSFAELIDRIDWRYDAYVQTEDLQSIWPDVLEKLEAPDES